MHYTPAAWVIQKFGGPFALAKAIGRPPSTVLRWRKRWRGCDECGRIPSDSMATILILARQRRLDIKAQDLILGRDSDEQPMVPLQRTPRPELVTA